ncbi:MAG: 5-formyltetrahydrofolate cyclo-ligase [Pseudomonadota bacterium]
MGSKKALREQMKTLRAELSARDPDAGLALAERFSMRLLERYGPEVAGYVPIKDEIDPRPLMARLEKAGAELSLPRLGETDALTFHRWSPGEPLEAGPLGLQQPCASAPDVTPTLVLCPVLAFDGLGTRLGYGKGHYDRTLKALRAAGRAFACALAFHGQMREEVPREAHDEPLDWAATEAGPVPLFMMRNMGAISAARSAGSGR